MEDTISWIHPYHLLMYLVCMVTPRGSKCRDYILKTYGDCYLNLNYDMFSITRFPHWLWTRVINGQRYDLLVDTSRPKCLPLVYQSKEPNYFCFYYVLKLGLLVGITAVLVYSIVRIAARRSLLR